ncbi:MULTISPECIES: tripartite tricarboxylate transporter substrate binding protein [unclassified Paenibacillus]|uniref:tripartite tricarboxylate transporter substrate binding protein n=1 Tax=Paenibacillus TaxID=44249 RepID=UPI0006CF24C8|nr:MULTISPECIES: tripartite tricarboxylate transporter substrate binding protein [unclassified Paenibacillus]
MKKNVITMMAVLLTLTLLFGCAQAPKQGEQAQSGQPEAAKAKFPTKPINLIVPWAAGGSTDLMARTLAKEVEKELGQPVMVVNKAGGGGTLAVTEVSKSAPDGYTLVISSNSPFTTQPLLNQLEYSIDDFRIVHATTFEDLVFAAHVDSPYKTLDDVLNAKGSGKAIKYATSGAGGLSNLAAETFFETAGMKRQHVPYKSGAEVATAVLGQQVDIGIAHPGELMEYVKSGKIRFIGVFNEKRVPEMPDVPTMSEKGIDVKWGVYKFIAVPKGTPEDVYQVLNKAFAKAFASDAFHDFLTKSNLIANNDSPHQVEEKIRTELKVTKEWIDKIGFGK